MAALAALAASAILSGCAEPSDGGAGDQAQRALSAPGVPQVQPPTVLPSGTIGVVATPPPPDVAPSASGEMLPYRAMFSLANSPVAPGSSGARRLPWSPPTASPEENTCEPAE
jgi:hypothetical protein